MTTARLVMHKMGTCAALLAVGYGLSVPCASAGNLAYEVNLGYGHSDNIGRSESNEIDEDIAGAGLSFSFDEQTARLRADLAGDFAYYDYLDNTYDGEVLGNFAGNARFAFVPQRFEWVLSDNFGQVLTDPFSPATPDNRENLNYLTTGPDVTLAFGQRSRLRLGARYSMATYEDRPFDSKGYGGEAGFIRLLSGDNTISLNARVQSTEYDVAALNADYDQSEAFVRYDAVGARTHLTVDVGYTEVERQNDSEDGLLLRLDAARRLTQSSTATLSVGREFSNSAGAFASLQGAGNADLSAVPGRQTPQPFTNDRVALGWDFQRVRTGFSVTAFWNEQKYEDANALDQELLGAGVQLRRNLSQKSSLGLNAGYASGKFEQGVGDYDDVSSGMALQLFLSSSVSLIATYDRVKRDSNLPGGDYTENRFWLSLAYGRGTPRSTLAPPQFPTDQRM